MTKTYLVKSAILRNVLYDDIRKLFLWRVRMSSQDSVALLFGPDRGDDIKTRRL
jgi:hypothetical protein